jgi:NarL family two-component system response regulator LiaR
MSPPIRLFVTDDHSMVRKGIIATVALADDIEVVGEASDGASAVAGTAATQPDVVLMDLVMPKMDGIDAIRQIKATQPNVRVLVLTSFIAEDKIFPAIKAGALGYQLKDSGPDELLNAIRQVHAGESSLHPIIARKVLQEITRPPEAPPTPDPLTHRELDVLKEVARGKENPEIAASLHISPATVRTHISNILGKLHLASRTQAALYALREGLASLSNEDVSPPAAPHET